MNTEYKKNIANSLGFVLLALSFASPAQQLSEEDLQAINQELVEQLNGVSVEALPSNGALADALNAAGVRMTMGSYWADAAIKDAQDFGVVALDADQKILDVFGASTPLMEADDGLMVPGYELPPGGRFDIVGSAGYANAVSVLATEKIDYNVTPSLEKVIGKIVGAGGYMFDQLCSMRGRPTQIELHLDAGLNWVVKATTGTKVVWNMEDLCE